MKDEEWSGLLKIPDEVLIKEYRLEIGKLKSHIDELEYELSNKDNYKMYEGDMKLIKEKFYYKKLHSKILELETQIKKHKMEKDSLIYQIVKLNEGKS